MNERNMIELELIEKQRKHEIYDICRNIQKTKRELKATIKWQH